ncbi:MAG: hypothetical protein P8M80_14670 [Pirellulaceae bacterium]|nr:hypothetical protein [Pirellulaceae bacterium]
MRRRHTTSDSLDMLLDTITNTFGGIVFLALLIVILMNNEQPSDATDESTETAEITQTIQALTERKNALLQMQTAQQVITGLSSTEGEKNQLQTARERAAQYAKLRDEIDQTLEKRLAISDQIQNDLTEMGAVNRQISDAETLQSKSLENLQLEIENRKKEIDLPKERETQKAQTAVLVKQGRLHVLDKSLGRGRFEINKEHFEECSKKDATLVITEGNYRARQGGGVSITDETVLLNQLNKVNAGGNYLTVAIWGDSFGDFETMRDICRKLNLEYELIPMQPEGTITDSTRSTKPKVQLP